MSNMPGRNVLLRVSRIGLTLIGLFFLVAPILDVVGHSVTFGAHDSAILGRSLVADIGVPILLALAAPTVFTRPATSPDTGAAVNA
jgi:hypothetical protein